MDKLEKAVQKARAARQGHLGTTHIAGTAMSRAEAKKSASFHVPSSLTPEALIEETSLEKSRIVAHRTRHEESDIFRILRTQVLQAMAHAEHRSLAITSPNYGDGKTTVAFNLAVSIALDVKQTVLLVDLDLRKPDMHKMIGLESPLGLTDHLINDVPLSQCLVRPSFERLSILPAGKALDHSSEVIGSPKMAALAEELERRYHDRLIIYDMPPILEQDDSMAFLPHVGAVLLVVRDGVTPIPDIRHSISALSGAHVIGTVLNHALS
jgi:capsular exopolysaccharide synthesis family protein